MGGMATYDENDPLELRLAKCIAFELSRGGNEFAAARAIVRDINHGWIKLFPAERKQWENDQAKSAREDARDAAIEASWKERQGEDYGSY